MPTPVGPRLPPTGRYQRSPIHQLLAQINNGQAWKIDREEIHTRVGTGICAASRERGRCRHGHNLQTSLREIIKRHHPRKLLKSRQGVEGEVYLQIIDRPEGE